MNDFSVAEWKYLLKKSDMNFCSHIFYDSMMSNPSLMNILITIIRGVYDTELKVTRVQLEYALKMADKQLYVKFRDRIITYD